MAASVTCVDQLRYLPLFTQLANAWSVIPAPFASEISSSSDSPALPSAGWWSYSAVTYGASLPSSAAHADDADARVEYCVDDRSSRIAIGWYTSLILLSDTYWLSVWPAWPSYALQTGHMKSRYTSTVTGPLPSTRPSAWLVADFGVL